MHTLERLFSVRFTRAPPRGHRAPRVATPNKSRGHGRAKVAVASGGEREHVGQIHEEKKQPGRDGVPRMKQPINSTNRDALLFHPQSLATAATVAIARHPRALKCRDYRNRPSASAVPSGLAIRPGCGRPRQPARAPQCRRRRPWRGWSVRRGSGSPR